MNQIRLEIDKLYARIDKIAKGGKINFIEYYILVDNCVNTKKYDILIQTLQHKYNFNGLDMIVDNLKKDSWREILRLTETSLQDKLYAQLKSKGVYQLGIYYYKTIDKTKAYISDSTGTGSILEPIVLNGGVNSIKVISGGYGYSSTASVVIEGGIGQATANAVVKGGKIYQVTISSTGSYHNGSFKLGSITEKEYYLNTSQDTISSDEYQKKINNKRLYLTSNVYGYTSSATFSTWVDSYNYEKNVVGLYSSAIDYLISYNRQAPFSVETISATGSYSLSFGATGKIVSDGGYPIIESGFIWGSSIDPVIGLSSSTYVGTFTGVGEFSNSPISVDYSYEGQLYVRAWARNSNGYSYGDSIMISVWLCLAKGTDILLSNGISKKIEDLDYSDELLVWNFDECRFDSSNPLWIKSSQVANQYNLLKFSDGSELKTISQHRIFNKERGQFTYPMTDDTPIGTTTFNYNGDYVKLISKSIHVENIEHYNIITDRHMNLFANGILTSCSYNNIYPISEMKFIKDNRSLRSRDEFLTIDDKYFTGLRLSEQIYDISSIVEYIERLKGLEYNNILV